MLGYVPYMAHVAINGREGENLLTQNAEKGEPHISWWGEGSKGRGGRAREGREGKRRKYPWDEKTKQKNYTGQVLLPTVLLHACHNHTHMHMPACTHSLRAHWHDILYIALWPTHSTNTSLHTDVYMCSVPTGIWQPLSIILMSVRCLERYWVESYWYTIQLHRAL